MLLKNLTKEERSLLLFFEAVAVDYGGKLNPAHMNEDDLKIAEKWTKKEFILFGRIYSKDITSDRTHWCLLMGEAWQLAHEERQARHKMLWEKRDWMTTYEKNNPPLSGTTPEGSNSVLNSKDI
jgi:hypothetical protein